MTFLEARRQHDTNMQRLEAELMRQTAEAERLATEAARKAANEASIARHKAAVEAEKAQAQAALRARADSLARQKALDVWLRAGGSPEAFDEEWPAIAVKVRETAMLQALTAPQRQRVTL